MKKRLLIISLMSMISLFAFSQDKLYFHNGKIAEGKVIETSDIFIKFIYKGEDIVNTMSRNALEKVELASGRVMELSQKIIIESPYDYDKVRVVYDKNEVLGLKSLGQIEKHSSGTWSFSITAGHFSEKTLKKIRKEAAKRGGCIVLILSSQSKSGTLFSGGHASMTGEIYTY